MWSGEAGRSGLCALEAAEGNVKPQLPPPLARALVQVHRVLRLKPNNICVMHMTEEVQCPEPVRRGSDCFCNIYSCVPSTCVSNMNVNQAVWGISTFLTTAALTPTLTA